MSNFLHEFGFDSRISSILFFYSLLYQLPLGEMQATDYQSLNTHMYLYSGKLDCLQQCSLWFWDHMKLKAHEWKLHHFLPDSSAGWSDQNFISWYFISYLFQSIWLFFYITAQAALKHKNTAYWSAEVSCCNTEIISRLLLFYCTFVCAFLPWL